MKHAENGTISEFLEHPFRFLWKGTLPSSLEEARKIIQIIETNAADLIFNNEPDLAPRADLDSIFMPYHLNGTFMIGERFQTTKDPQYQSQTSDGIQISPPYAKFRGQLGSGSPQTFSDPALHPPPYIRAGEVAGFELWAYQTTYEDLLIMEHEGALPAPLAQNEKQKVAEAVTSALQFKVSGGDPLCSLIPNQNYIDYIRRAIALYLTGDPDREFFTETSYDTVSREVAFSIITQYLTRYSQGEDVNLDLLRTLMTLSILAGAVGLDMKCSHCATSTFTVANTVFFDSFESPQDRVDAVYRWMKQKADNGSLICDELFVWNRYVDLVLRGPCKLVVLPDDLGETVFDLFQIQSQMAFNEQLDVDFIPRATKHHNDASFRDVDKLLEEPCFDKLRHWRDQSRFTLSANGPRTGAVEGRKLSRTAANLILDADVLYVKGSRSYELLATGIKVPTFSGQTITREFSESITGADSDAGVPALTFYHAFPDFWGFTERHSRTEPLFPTGKLGWQARMTAIESAKATNSWIFRELLQQRSREEVSEQIMEQAIDEGKPPHVVVVDAHNTLK